MRKPVERWRSSRPWKPWFACWKSGSARNGAALTAAAERAVIRGQANGLRRYFCRGCGKTFNCLTGTPLARLRHKERWSEFGASMSKGETVATSAERCGVAGSTAFRWRHRFLRAVSGGVVKLRGIVEADETFVLASRKGERNLDRKPRRLSSRPQDHGAPRPRGHYDKNRFPDHLHI